MSDRIILSERVTIEFTDEAQNNLREPAYNWLEKWENEYRIIKEYFFNADDLPEEPDLWPNRYDIICTKYALENLPKGLRDLGSEWTEKGIIIDSIKNRTEEFLLERQHLQETDAIPLKKPLKLKQSK